MVTCNCFIERYRQVDIQLSEQAVNWRYFNEAKMRYFRLNDNKLHSIFILFNC